MRRATALLLFVTAVLHAQADWAAVEKTALEEMKAMNVPGASIAVVKDNKVLWTKGLGVASVETNAHVTPDMLFRLGSTTKMFTAAAVINLVDDGKVKLDQPVGTYVKTLPPAVGAVTVHQLLSHTAGLIDRASMAGSHDEDALGKSIAAWKDDMLFTKPGKVFSYSNPGYWLAGFLSETLDGVPYATVLAQRIFRPLGMSRTTLRPLYAMTYPMAQGHNAAPGKKPQIVRPAADDASNWPAGSIFSSADELARWMIALMDAGKIDGKQVLSPTLLKRLGTIAIHVPGEPWDYGYGLVADSSRGTLIVQHGGARAGYGSVIIMAPEHRTGVVILANRSGAALNKTSELILSSLVPLKPEPENDLSSPQSIPAPEFPNYTGVFVNDGSQVEIAAENGKLYVKQGTSSVELRRHSGGRHSIQPKGAPTPVEATLIRDDSGRVQYLVQGLRALARQ